MKNLVPESIKVLRAEKRLVIAFPGGTEYSLPAELLRVESPSAEVQGHSPDQKTLVSGRRDVAIVGVEPVGNYAVRILFDDGHDSGLYSWDYLHAMGRDQDTLWANYLRDLEQAGLSREPGSEPLLPMFESGGCGSSGKKSGGGCGCGH